MKFDRAGREYVSWPATTGAPTGAAFEIQFGNDPAWYAMENVSGVPRILLAGPDADKGTAAYVLPLGRTLTKIRLTDTPEIVPRDGGPIDCA